ncbi:MAG TPA: hypothetical protein VMY37_36725 [Thermoguttaceae bacterium]|nr:hypothetical protein [Thermoguttaceae bacterium]
MESFLVFAFLGALTGAHASVIVVELNPNSTYLRTVNDGALSPAFNRITLADLGLTEGDTVTMQSKGDYRRGTEYQDVFTDVVAVFSSTAEFLDASYQDRIPGAIDFGDDHTTPPTFNGLKLTDIPQDFLVPTTPLSMTIPVNAAYLFFSPDDVLFYDNTDPDDDYEVWISAPGANAIPEPASLAIWASLGALGLVGRWRRRARGRS